MQYPLYQNTIFSMSKLFVILFVFFVIAPINNIYAKSDSLKVQFSIDGKVILDDFTIEFIGNDEVVKPVILGSGFVKPPFYTLIPALIDSPYIDIHIIIDEHDFIIQ